MLELIFKNLFTLHIGIFIRYLFLRYIKKNRDISYKQLLIGEKNKRNDIKQDEINCFNNEIKNRLYGIIFLIIIVIVIIILTQN